MRRLCFVMLLLLSITTAGCTTARRVVGGLIETTDYNRGTLVGVPSMSLQEIREKSTFDLGAGHQNNTELSKRVLLIRSYRFDWQLPNSSVKFKDCAGYTIITDDETGERIVTMDVFTGRKYFTWTEVKAEAYQVEQMLIHDGWQPTISQNGEKSPDRFHREMENPNFATQVFETVSSFSYTKGDVEFILGVKIGKNFRSPDVGEGENFLHSAIVIDKEYQRRKSEEMEKWRLENDSRHAKPSVGK